MSYSFGTPYFIAISRDFCTQLNPYRFSFNGKENDNEIKGEGNQQDYGFRIHDTRLCRFLSVDPLTQKFPELTPYQFASNTPIQAIDLDGKEAFFIHGTNSSPEAWTPRLTYQISRIYTNSIHRDATFDWRRDVGGENLNRLRNGATDRSLAAMMLVVHVMNYRKVNNITNEEITLIGHSHGGNIAIQAAAKLNDLYGIQVNIITINTPAFNGQGDRENPDGNPGINDMISFNTDGDGVAGQIAPGSDDSYNETEGTPVRNYELQPLESGPFDAHALNSVSLKSMIESGATKLNPVPQESKNPPNQTRKTQ